MILPILSILLTAGLLLPAHSVADTLSVTVTDDAGAGSLRQAILDANANAGPDFIVFDIPNTDAGFNGLWWTISLATELPPLNDSGTALLGSSQAQNHGDTNPGLVGTGGTVGVDQMALPQYQRPEILISSGGFNGITIGATASDIFIEGVAIVHATNGIVAAGLSDAGTAGSNRLVRGALVGVLPDGSDPDTLRNTGHGIMVDAPAEGLPANTLVVESSFVGYNGQVGIVSIRGETVLSVTSCEVFSNGHLTDAHDGIDVNGLPSQVINNLSRDNTNASAVANPGSGHGIEAGSQDPGTGGHLIQNNTVTGNLGAGIAIRAGSSNNLVSRNVVTGNGVGLYVNAEQAGQTDGNEFSLNSTYANLGLGIDLHAGLTGVAFDGITLNSPTSGTGGSNRLVAFPIIETAEIEGDTLTVTGFADPGGRIDVFEADADATGFGEGKAFLFTRVEGSADDADDSEGTYGPLVNQFVVSTEALTTNRFSFAVVLPSAPDSVLLTANQTVELPDEAAGKLVSVNTSEFSPVIMAKRKQSPVASERDEIPGSFKLLGAYPNPFNPVATIAFELERPGMATLTIFNAQGAEVSRPVDGRLGAGTHRATWLALDATSGTYFYRLSVDGETLTGTVTLLK
jgi:parallel beta-helix repeat protein